MGSESDFGEDSVLEIESLERNKYNEDFLITGTVGKKGTFVWTLTSYGLLFVDSVSKEDMKSLYDWGIKLCEICEKANALKIPNRAVKDKWFVDSFEFAD